MTVVATTDIYDASGEDSDQKMETADATPENVTRMFNALDWQHPTNTCGIAVSRPAGTSPLDRDKLVIRREYGDRGEPIVLLATLQETPPGASDDEFYKLQPLESPEVGLQLLLSFLAQDGKYRTMVQWQ
jgi:hypothetical protein